MYLEYRRLFKESSSLPPYKTTYNRIPALPICSTVASGLVIKKDICCNSSDSVIFFKRLVFPWPYVAEVVSQPLHAWINRRCDVSTSPALLTRSGTFHNYKPVFVLFASMEIYISHVLVPVVHQEDKYICIICYYTYFSSFSCKLKGAFHYHCDSISSTVVHDLTISF